MTSLWEVVEEITTNLRDAGPPSVGEFESRISSLISDQLSFIGLKSDFAMSIDNLEALIVQLDARLDHQEQLGDISAQAIVKLNQRLKALPA